ncbi:MAG TPA: dienelactone hydrolase family protein [Solirubrobacteraceae bacterium]
MSPATRVETGDGACDAHLELPASGRGRGMLLIHEIFGVNDYVRASARRLADMGYVVLAPDLFWRTQPGLELRPDQAGVRTGREAVAELDLAAAVGDAIAALQTLRALPEVTDGRAGVIGFCFGGTIAYEVAVNADPDVAVVYYGSGIPAALDRAGAIACPTIMHWGGADPFIPREQVDAVAAMAAAHASIECHVHEGAGHAFDNHLAPMFHNPDARAAAWELTAAFLAREFPVKS